MLALFGPIPGRLVAAYNEVRPLSDGWLDRQSLFQLVPLLVHAVLFGNGYPSMVREVASRLMRVAKSRLPIFLVGHVNKEGSWRPAA